jgi:hypothetical protein
MDAPGEEALIQTIADLKKLGVTVIVVAHRPSVLADMDKMLVLQERHDGRIWKQGRSAGAIFPFAHSASGQCRTLDGRAWRARGIDRECQLVNEDSPDRKNEAPNQVSLRDASLAESAAVTGKTPQPPMRAAAGGALQLSAGGGDAPEMGFMNPTRMVRKGIFISIVFVFGSLAWASFAQLESAVTAPAVIVVETHRKTIQHLEGGIVKEILVAEGDNVSLGQPLLRLEETQAQTNLSVLQDQVDALSAQEARLFAERDGAARIAFPADLVARRAQPKIDEMLRGEENTFLTRKNSLAKQIDILAQRNSENKSQIAGLQSQQEAVEQQGTLILQEASGVEDL